MEDTSQEVRMTRPMPKEPLRETLEEAEYLAAAVERAVHEGTARRIRDLSVEINEDGVLLRGRCGTYYCKQLAQHAAMTKVAGDRLTNSIEVM